MSLDPDAVRAARPCVAIGSGTRAVGSVALIALVHGAPARVCAQPGARADVDLGVAVLRQPGLPARTAPTLGGVWAWSGARTVVRTDGVVAAGAGDWAGQLAARAAYLALDPGAPLELSAAVRAARVAGSPGTTQLVVGARRHLTTGGVLRSTRGLWAGALGGMTGDGSHRTAALVGVEAGAWRAISAATRTLLTATWTATRADSAALVGAQTGTDPFGPATSRVRSFDASAVVEHLGRSLEATGSAGVRRSAVSPGAVATPATRWSTLAIGAVTWWIRPGLGAVVTAGASPADPARGLPAAQHLAFTVRLRSGGSQAADSRRALPASVDLVVDGPVLRVRAPGAARVQLRAAATAWRAVDLVRGMDGEWTLALTWASGAHRVALRVDDGRWQPPANTPAVDDEFGGRVGLLVVP